MRFCRSAGTTSTTCRGISAFRPEKMRLVPLGINLDGYTPRHPAAATVHDRVLRARRAGEGPARAGRRLSAAARASRHRQVAPRCGRLSGAGAPGVSRSHHGGSARRGASTISSSTAARWIARQKIEFLRSLDVLSVPATYDEPKGIFLLEAMAAACRSCSRGAARFPEIVEKTGGGLIVDADDPEALADGPGSSSGGIRRARPRSAPPGPPACASTTPSSAWRKPPKPCTSELSPPQAPGGSDRAASVQRSRKSYPTPRGDRCRS